MMYYLRKSLKLIKCEGKLLGSGSPRIENYTNALSLVLTCFVCTLKHQNHFWKSCTKGFVGVIQEEDPCRTELLPKDIGGQTCKKRRRNVKKCDQCQRYPPNIHQLGGVLNPLSSPWPFA